MVPLTKVLRGARSCRGKTQIEGGGLQMAEQPWGGVYKRVGERKWAFRASGVMSFGNPK